VAERSEALVGELRAQAEPRTTTLAPHQPWTLDDVASSKEVPELEPPPWSLTRSFWDDVAGAEAERLTIRNAELSASLAQLTQANSQLDRADREKSTSLAMGKKQLAEVQGALGRLTPAHMPVTTARAHCPCTLPVRCTEVQGALGRLCTTL
jgi:hypothetical protein